MSDENLYAVRDEIVARLDQFMDEWGVKKIYTPKNLGVTTELSQITPNIQVNFRRTKSAGVVSKGDALKLKVVWEVTACCKHAASQVTDGSKAFDMAGDLTIKIIKKLSGWEPESSVEPLIYMNTEEDISKSCVYSTVVLESELFIQTEPD